MPFDTAVHSIAASYVREQCGADWVPVRPFKMDEPAGVFFWVERRDRNQHLDGPSPFFVLADTGRVISFTARTMRMMLIEYFATHPDFVRAVARPGKTIEGHEETYVQFVRDCIAAAERQSA